MPGVLTEQGYRRRIARVAQECYELRLYVAGNGPLSSQAIHNVNVLCRTHLEGRYHLEVVDIHQQPQAVAAAGLVAAPTLIKILPLPARRLVGDLARGDTVMRRLNMISNPIPAGE